MDSAYVRKVWVEDCACYLFTWRSVTSGFCLLGRLLTLLLVYLQACKMLVLLMYVRFRQNLNSIIYLFTWRSKYVDVVDVR